MGGCYAQKSIGSCNTNRWASILQSSSRHKSSYVVREVHGPLPNTQAVNKSDTNLDTCCLGWNFVVLSYTKCTVDVFPYDKSYSPIQNVLLWTKVTLLHPNQIWYDGHRFLNNVHDRHHTKLCIDVNSLRLILLNYTGIHNIEPGLITLNELISSYDS